MVDWTLFSSSNYIKFNRTAAAAAPHDRIEATWTFFFSFKSTWVLICVCSSVCINIAVCVHTYIIIIKYKSHISCVYRCTYIKNNNKKKRICVSTINTLYTVKKKREQELKQEYKKKLNRQSIHCKNWHLNPTNFILH